MGLPAEGFEGVYRNKAEDVAAFLNERHWNHYKVFNLSQLTYDYSKFYDRVEDCGFPDHHPPSLGQLFEICGKVHEWLEKHPKNVVAVHCKVSLVRIPNS